MMRRDLAMPTLMAWSTWRCRQDERIILGLDLPIINADANYNFSIDMGDVVKVERMILGLK